MIKIKSFYFQKPEKNFSYIVWLESGEGIIIDPFESDELIQFASTNRIEVKAILNTHSHYDHIQGNEKIKSYFSCDNYLGLENLSKEIIKSFSLFALHTPGHSKDHFVYSFFNTHLFTGDIIFQGGVGKCFGEETPLSLSQSVINILNSYSLDTFIYPGHDYIHNNFNFAKSLNFFSSQLPNLAAHPEGKLSFNTLSYECQHNVFLWCLNYKNWIEIPAMESLKGNTPQECFINLRNAKDKFR